MLTPPDADIVRRDPVLPGLATALDTKAFSDALHPFLKGIDPSKTQIIYVRYKPMKSCLIAYRLQLGSERLHVYARTHPVQARPNLRNGQGRIALPDSVIGAFIFPHDKRLRALGRLVDPELRKNLLRKLAHDRPDLWEGSTRTLRYIPERRFVAQVETANGFQAALKVYDHNGYKAAKESTRGLHSGAVLRFARRLGHSDRHRIILYEWLSGRLLSEAILAPDFDSKSVSSVGAALAELHLQTPAGLASSTRESEILTLFALTDHLGFICPHLKKKAQDVARKLVNRLGNMPGVDRMIHGDFYAKQVVVGSESVGFIDFDRAVLGDPASDLGNFVAHLEHKVLCGLLPSHRMTSIQDAFLQGYEQTAGTHLPSGIEIYCAVGLFRLAPDPFRYHEPDWPVLTELILDRAEAILAKIAARKAVSVVIGAPSQLSENRKPEKK